MTAPLVSSRTQPRDVTTLKNGLTTFIAWHAANPQAPVEELWEVYDAHLRLVWSPFTASWLALRITTSQRAPLAAACAILATARLWYAPLPSREEGEMEAKLWEVAFGLDARSMEKRPWDSRSGYTSPAHRLADLYRRTGRTDPDAVSLLIDVSTGAQPTFFSDKGLGAHHHAHQLIHDGAVITEIEPRDILYVRDRLSLCYRLKLRGFAAPWVQSSLEVGKARIQRWHDEQRPRQASKAAPTKRSRGKTPKPGLLSQSGAENNAAQ